MLLRSSVLIYPGLHLVTLGATCRYLITGETGTSTLSDPGCSAHVTALTDRLSRLGVDHTKISTILLTNCDPDRVAGLPLLRRMIPGIKVVASTLMTSHLAKEAVQRNLFERDKELTALLGMTGKVEELSFDEYRNAWQVDRPLVESDTLSIDSELLLRLVATPGHRDLSVSYLLLPHEFLIVDQSFGYFRGRRFAAPGCDYDWDTALTSIKKFHDIEISGIGFPYGGAITGDLVRKHIDAVATNAGDIVKEFQQAVSEGVSLEDIRTQIYEAFYTSPLGDPCFNASLDETFEAIWGYLTTRQQVTQE